MGVRAAAADRRAAARRRAAADEPVAVVERGTLRRPALRRTAPSSTIAARGRRRRRSGRRRSPSSGRSRRCATSSPGSTTRPLGGTYRRGHPRAQPGAGELAGRLRASAPACRGSRRRSGSSRWTFSWPALDGVRPRRRSPRPTRSSALFAALPRRAGAGRPASRRDRAGDRRRAAGPRRRARRRPGARRWPRRCSRRCRDWRAAGAGAARAGGREVAPGRAARRAASRSTCSRSTGRSPSRSDEPRRAPRRPGPTGRRSPRASAVRAYVAGGRDAAAGRLQSASIGPITTAALRELGLEPDVEAADAHPDGLVAAVVASLSRPPQ